MKETPPPASPRAIPRYNLGMRPYIVVSLVAVLLYAFWGDDPPAGEGEYVEIAMQERPAPLEELVTRCAECHGGRGERSDGATPFIGGQHADYLLFAMRTYAMRLRRHEPMERAILDLSLQDMKRLARHYAAQEGNWRGQGLGRDSGPEQLDAGIDPVADGEALAQARCLHCHDGAKAAELERYDFHEVVAALERYRDAPPAMAPKAGAVAGLSRLDGERLAFFAVRQGPRRYQPPQRLARRCDICHGRDGRSHNGSRPILSGQAEGYLLATLHAYRNGERENAAMEAITRELSDLELAAIADFYARRP